VQVADAGALVISPHPDRRDDGVVLDSLELLLEPVPPGGWLGAVIEVTPRAALLELSGWDRTTRTFPLPPGRHHLYLPSPERRQGSSLIRFARTGNADTVVLLERMWIDRGHEAPALMNLSPAQQQSGLDGLVDQEGFSSVELLGTPVRPGRWTRSRAWLTVPAGRGALVVDLAAPRPTAAQVTLSMQKLRVERRLEVGPAWREVSLPIERATGRVWLLLEVTNPFVPANEDPGSTDSRELGVVLGSVTFVPDQPKNRS